MNGHLRELSLFTGIGGGLLGSMLLGWRTVAAVECDPYCVKILCKRGGYVADTKREQDDSEHGEPGRPREQQGRAVDTGGEAIRQTNRASGDDDLDGCHPLLRGVGGLRELSLFTGIGGGLLGSMLLGWRTVAAVECDPYCVKILCKRGGYVADGDCVGRATRQDSGAGGWVGQEESPARHGDFPIYADVRTFHPTPGSCDIVTGGFPCQPHSQAGKRLGGLDDRDLWPDTVRVLRESQAPLGFFENVPGLLTSRDADGFPMFGRILGDLSEAGFDAEWCVLGADDVGAPHRRKRLWILAVRHGYDAGMLARAMGGTAEGAGRDAALDLPSGCGEVSGGGPWWCDPADVGHANEPRPQGHGQEHELPEAGGQVCVERAGNAEPTGDDWLAEPYVGRVADGVPSRVDRLRGLGNAQVPQAMAAAFIVLARQAGLIGREGE